MLNACQMYKIHNKMGPIVFLEVKLNLIRQLIECHCLILSNGDKHLLSLTSSIFLAPLQNIEAQYRGNLISGVTYVITLQ